MLLTVLNIYLYSRNQIQNASDMMGAKVKKVMSKYLGRSFSKKFIDVGLLGRHISGRAWFRCDLLSSLRVALCRLTILSIGHGHFCRFRCFLTPEISVDIF